MEEKKDLKKEIINIVLDELAKRKIIKKSNSSFENSKELLKHYNKLVYSKKGIDKQILELEKSKDNLDINNHIKSSLSLAEKGVKQNLDTINNRIIELKQEIIKIDCFVNYIDSILENIKDNPDYEILDRVYFKNENPKDIAIEKNCDDATIYRKINRMVDEIKILLFPGKFIDELN